MERLLLVRFEGLFTCAQTAAGTEVTHRETFAFRPPLGRVVERFLAPWLARQVRDEVVRLQQLLEAKP